MKRKNGSKDNAGILTQRLYGTAKDNGRLICNARVALWKLPGKPNAVNAKIIRGRTSTGDGFVIQSQILRDGHFSLDVPYQDNNWYLLVEAPKGVVAVDGPFDVAKGDAKKVEVELRKPGAIRGSVTNNSSLQYVPLWVVAFSELGIQYETRVAANGNFAIDNVFPGQYGLKVGCDAMLDSEVPDTSERNLGISKRLEISRMPSAPWARATRVIVEEGSIADSIRLEFTR